MAPRPGQKTAFKRPAPKAEKVPPPKIKREAGKAPSTSTAFVVSEEEQQRQDETAWLAEFEHHAKEESKNGTEGLDC